METNYPAIFPNLSSWAEEDRPLNKIDLKGKASLSDCELLAIVLRDGSKDQNVVELARTILDSCGNDLKELGKMSAADLRKIKGMTDLKAKSVVALFELGRRKQSKEAMEKKKVTTSKDAADILQPMLADHTCEEFWILLLNRANTIIGTRKISEGGMTGTVADSKVIFRTALESNAVSVILCHNHPSGNLKPSDADIRLTKRLKQAGDAIEVGVLDHIIVASTGYYSFADEGMM